MALLDDDAIEQALRGLGWDREGLELVKVVTRADFAEAMGFVNEVAGLAEAMNHHPDITIRWNTVSLRLSTHSAGGITDKDVALASSAAERGGGQGPAPRPPVSHTSHRRSCAGVRTSSSTVRLRPGLC
jgi:4a-hydroxytetrahydrobiopterin dehydratase